MSRAPQDTIANHPARRRRAAGGRPVPLFEEHSESAQRRLVAERVAAFARAVARRHLAEYGAHSHAGCKKMRTALCGYYAGWSLCAPFTLPALDDGLLATADAAYAAALQVRKRAAAA